MQSLSGPWNDALDVMMAIDGLGAPLQPGYFALQSKDRPQQGKNAERNAAGKERQHRGKHHDEWRNYRIVAARTRNYTRYAVPRLDAVRAAP